MNNTVVISSVYDVKTQTITNYFFRGEKKREFVSEYNAHLLGEKWELRGGIMTIKGDGLMPVCPGFYLAPALAPWRRKMALVVSCLNFIFQTSVRSQKTKASFTSNNEHFPFLRQKTAHGCCPECITFLFSYSLTTILRTHNYLTK